MLQGELNSLFLDPRTFLFFLDKELACAERYNHYVSVLLLKPERPGKSEPGSSLDRLARALVPHVRKSDSVGSIRQGTLGIILSHTSIDGVGIVLERLRFEAMCLSGGPQKSIVKASYAVYPSEANSLGTLCDLAIQRLAGED